MPTGRGAVMRRFLTPPPDAPLALGATPSFSIVTPAYQAAGTVADAIESALAQTLEAHEVIVCDDGSTDDLEGALAPFRERITLLRRPHRGVGAARNEAIRASSGDFVVLLDADDRYEPDRLRALGELAATRPDLDILGTDAYYQVGDSLKGRFYEFTAFAAEEQRLAILDRCFVAWPALRRARVLDVGSFDESLAIAEDWDLFLRLILTGSKVGIVAEPLMRYRRHPASLTANRSRALRSRVAMLEKARPEVSLNPEERGYLERCLTRALSRSLLFDAQAIIADRRQGTRRRLLALAGSDAQPTTRLALVAAACAPAIAAPLLAWKERRVARSTAHRDALLR
jgi:glycosyltransferase involved in cell wall biosynthesis